MEIKLPNKKVFNQEIDVRWVYRGSTYRFIGPTDRGYQLAIWVEPETDAFNPSDDSSETGEWRVIGPEIPLYFAAMVDHLYAMYRVGGLDDAGPP